MKKRTLIVLFASCLLELLNGQTIEFGFQVGWGSYKMDALSEFMNDVDLPLDTRVVVDYPPYYYFQPELSWGNDTFSIGICDAFHSTGARVSVKDYSGEYRMDSKIKSHSPALIYKRRLFGFKDVQQRIYCKAGMGFSHMVFEEYFKLYERVESDGAYHFNSVSAFIEPGISITYTYSFLTLAMNLGYYWQYYASPLKEEHYGGTFYVYNYKSIARADWSGIRFGISFIVHKAR